MYSYVNNFVHTVFNIYDINLDNPHLFNQGTVTFEEYK